MVATAFSSSINVSRIFASSSVIPSSILQAHVGTKTILGCSEQSSAFGHCTRSERFLPLSRWLQEQCLNAPRTTRSQDPAIGIVSQCILFVFGALSARMMPLSQARPHGPWRLRLGIEAGATHTVAILANDQDQVMARVESG